MSLSQSSGEHETSEQANGNGIIAPSEPVVEIEKPEIEHDDDGDEGEGEDDAPEGGGEYMHEFSSR